MSLLNSKQTLEKYVQSVQRSEERQVDLGNWLPSMRKFLRPFVPGEVCTIIADTGHGKTAILQNIILSCPKLNVVLFELELPPDLVVERFLAMLNQRPAVEIERMVKRGDMPTKLDEHWNHVWACDRFGLSVADMEKIVLESNEVIGSAPNVVVVDYVGLVKGIGKSNYEKATSIMVELKNLAMVTDTVVFVASQIKRLSDDEEIGLHSAKDSGQIENSSGILISASRDNDKPGEILFKIHKSTKGGGGNRINAKFDGPSLRIWE